MIPNRPRDDDQYSDGTDPALATVDGGNESVDPSRDDDSDAAAAAFRMDMLGGSADAGSLEAPKRSVMGSQNLLLAMVVLAAGGALLAMRYLGMGPRSSLAQILNP